MKEHFKVGDIVYLKSGGPPMTIYNVYQQRSVECWWFRGTILIDDLFNYETLTKKNPNKVKRKSEQKSKK